MTKNKEDNPIAIAALKEGEVVFDLGK